ncbi:hypothetical protein OI25_6022 [Paraburkholderia fungorum]|uniref:Uncharacterized protein n=1 Tax=Paraburkholderia fungorum TaxID=134537 RepID=A0AAU8TDF3_9BURK|nr:hypothetical protein OI25_6022 [Paraburkholderia fungorum]
MSGPGTIVELVQSANCGHSPLASDRLLPVLVRPMLEACRLKSADSRIIRRGMHDVRANEKLSVFGATQCRSRPDASEGHAGNAESRRRHGVSFDVSDDCVHSLVCNGLRVCICPGTTRLRCRQFEGRSITRMPRLEWSLRRKGASDRRRLRTERITFGRRNIPRGEYRSSRSDACGL